MTSQGCKRQSPDNGNLYRTNFLASSTYKFQDSIPSPTSFQKRKRDRDGIYRLKKLEINQVIAVHGFYLESVSNQKIIFFFLNEPSGET